MRIPMTFLCRSASKRLEFLRGTGLFCPEKEGPVTAEDVLTEIGILLALHLALALAVTVSLV